MTNFLIIKHRRLTFVCWKQSWVIFRLCMVLWIRKILFKPLEKISLGLFLNIFVKILLLFIQFSWSSECSHHVYIWKSSETRRNTLLILFLFPLLSTQLSQQYPPKELKIESKSGRFAGGYKRLYQEEI